MSDGRDEFQWFFEQGVVWWFLDGPIRWDRDFCNSVWKLAKEKGYDMAAVKRGRKPAVNEVAGALATALRFLSVGYKASGDDQANHTWFNDGWGCSFDGVIAAGIPIEGLDFNAYLDTKLLNDALTRVGKDLKLTVLPNGLHVSSGHFDAIVPSGDITKVVGTPPDMGSYPIDERFIAAMDICGRYISDTAPDFVASCVVTKLGENGSSQTLLATNGKAVVEAVHGTNMPPGLVMPKAFVTALNKVEAKPVKFGFSPDHITLWFDNGGFIRSQLYKEAYPQSILANADTLLTAPHTANIPEALYDAITSVCPFGGPDMIVHFVGGAVRAGPGTSGGDIEWAASLDVKGVQDGVSAPAKPILALLDTAKQIYLGGADDEPQRVVMFGPFWRAAVSAQRPDLAGSAPVPQPAAQQPATLPWAAPPAPAPEAPQTAPTPPPAAFQPPPAPVAPVTLPFTPYERQNDPATGAPAMRGAPGWDSYPYTLQPGETTEHFFADSRNHVAMAAHGIPLPSMPAAPATPPTGQPNLPWQTGGAPLPASPVPLPPSPATPAPASGAAPSPTTAAPFPFNPNVPATAADKPWMQNLGNLAPEPPAQGFTTTPTPDGWTTEIPDED